MEHHTRRQGSPFGRALLWVLLSLTAVVGGAFLLGKWLWGSGERTVTEPGELYYPVEPYTGPAKGAAAGSASAPTEQDNAEAGDLAGGVRWPGLSEERRASLSGQTVGWGQGVEVNDRNQPTGALAGQEKYGELGAYYIFPQAENVVYLTFDLGYENGYTGKILDALKEKNVHGVFFVTMDYVRSAPEMVQRILDEGHVLGNHSVHHPSMPSCSTEEATQEIMGLHDYVKEHFGGYEMTLFRFPRGEFSEKTLVLARDLGYASVFWSYAYVDWKTDAQPDVAASLEKLANAAHPGAIYLLHTVSATNAALMGDLIDRLQADGYTIGVMPH